MLLVLSKRAPKNDRNQYIFSTKELLPAFNTSHEPKIVVFVSLHCEKQVFGYLATAYDSVDNLAIDEHYVKWCDAFSKGLQALQRKLYGAYLKGQREIFSVYDPATGLNNIKGFMEQLPRFIISCHKSVKGCILLMLTNVPKNNISAQLGVDEALIIANALRLSSGAKEILSRVRDNVFVILLKTESNEIEEIIVKNRMLALEKNIRYLQGNVARPQLPELITEHCSIECEKVSDIEEVVMSRLTRITEKASAAANNLCDVKEQLYQLRREIYLTPQEDWNIPMILKKVGISRSHFQRIYKAQFSVNCIDDIINARLKRAEQLLTYTDMRIQEIALQCGYSNENHLMRQFKDKFGRTTSQFRNQKENKMNDNVSE
jgi:AraC-like DNA-binding protein